MALPISLTWEVRQATGNDAWGGGWAPVTVSTFSGSNLVVDGSLNTKVTSASHNFVAADVGARIEITNAAPSAWTPGFYTILSVAANAATLNASPAVVGTTSGVWAMVGNDYSQQNAVQVAIDNSIITTSITANVITFTGYTPTVADVGNSVQMLTGTNVTVGWYVITAFTATTWTVAGTAALPTSGTTTNATGNMGGALATLNKLALALVGSNKAYAKGAFTSTATISFSLANVGSPTNTNPASRVIGYGTVRGDATHATLTLQTNTGLTGLDASGVSGVVFEQIDVDCGSLGTSTGIKLQAFCKALRCKVSNFTTAGITISNAASEVIDTEITGGGAAATAALNHSAGVGFFAMGNFIHDNACPGATLAQRAVLLRSLIVNNSGASSDGILANQDPGWIVENTIHNNGRHGINFASDVLTNGLVLNNLLTNNGGYGISRASSPTQPAFRSFDGNAYGGGASANTSGTRNGIDSFTGQFGITPYTNVRDVILSASPYVGPTTGTTANFALNTTAGGGAAVRAAGIPSLWPGNTGTTGYPDMGAVQHQDTSFAGIKRQIALTGGVGG